MARLQRKSSRFFSLLLGLPVLLVVGSAAAQTYPSQPVTLIHGFGDGGEVHRAAHAISQWLAGRLGQQVIVESRRGDSTNIAAEAVVRASPDGYTLLVASAANAINATLYEKLSFNFIRDTTPVAGLVRLPIVLVVNPAFPPESVPELIAFAKAYPGKVTMAAPSTTLALAAASFTMMTGLKMARSSIEGDVPALIAVAAGKLQLQFAGLGAGKPYITSGQLRALAVGSARREQALPDVPTIGEFVPGYEMSAWLGIGAPKNTRTEIVERLSKEITAGLSDPVVQARLAHSNHIPMPMTSTEFGKFVADETEKLGKLVRLTGMKPQ
jgi:tripartite-type tricarboxylate transporter receptor subunit TctC